MRMLIVVRHVPHCPSSLMLFHSEDEALAFEDPDGGHIEWQQGSDGVRRVIGTWADIDPSSLRAVP